MKWGQAEKEKWFSEQKIQRSYLDDVVPKIHALNGKFEVSRYGSLPINPAKYPLYLLRSRHFRTDKKTILVTGGVHGYETSGVHGALAFMAQIPAEEFTRFNFFCAPCLSPWAYDTVNRWNPNALDPNRNFFPDSPAEECKLFLEAMTAFEVAPFAHFDLHETTDTDNTIFRPAKAARDGVEPDPFSEIPDGFYLVGDTARPVPEFQKAIIDSVRKVTHIAPADAEGKLIGVPLEQEGVVNYDKKKLFLCGGFSNAKYVTTTEVYPDSPKVNPQNCIDAQVAAVNGGLSYLRNL